MFGYYTNKRLSKNERKILHEEPDDYIWYKIIISQLFMDSRFFQVREDIELPQNENDDGVILIFEKGSIVYFKTLDEEVNNKKIQSIYDVCSFLEEEFNQPIEAYVLCPPHQTIKEDKIIGEKKVKITFSSSASHDGEKIIEQLENKLKNNEKFTTTDSINHILLPFTGYQDKEIFKQKYQHYKNMINTCDGN